MKIEQFKKLKVGDKVRIVSTPQRGDWVDDMDKFCGRVATVDSIYDSKIRVKEFPWSWYPEFLDGNFRECVKEIHITVDGDKTIAVLKENGKVVKRAESKCAPEDKFDFKTGAKLALERLFVKEVKRKAEVGEYIKIVNAVGAHDLYENGDIFKVYKAASGLNGVYCDMPKKTTGNYIKDNGNILIWDSEYVVLEGYTPPEEKKPEFTPHLLCDGEHYGVIGEPTNYKDAIGRPLCIGDTVEHFDEGNESCGETAIVCHNGKSFVMGIESCCDDKTGEIHDGWKIIKKRSFEEVEDGEKTSCDVEYIKTEKGR